nr:hypothetical protein [Tanacetum cinerariifolium]
MPADQLQMKELVSNQGFSMYQHMILMMRRFLKNLVLMKMMMQKSKVMTMMMMMMMLIIKMMIIKNMMIKIIFDPRVQTPSHVESTDDEDSDEEIQGANVEEENMDEEATNKEDEVNELYRDVNVNLEGRDTKMTDASLTNVQGTQVTEDTHVIITNPVNPKGQRQSSFVSSGFVFNMLNPGPDTGIDSVFNINTESTSLVEVSVTTIAEEPLSAAITLPPPPTPLITHLQQTPVPTPAIMNEAVKIVVQLQSDRLKDEAQAKNEVFINKLNDNIKKIIKDQVKEQVKAQVSKILPKIEKTVNEQLNAEVLTRSSNESKTSHTIVANLSELEL